MANAATSFQQYRPDSFTLNSDKSSRSSRPQPTPIIMDNDHFTVQNAPISPVRVEPPSPRLQQASSATIEHGGLNSPRSPPPARLPRTAVAGDPHEAFGQWSTQPPQLPFLGTHVRNVSAPRLEKDPLEAKIEEIRLRYERSRSATPTRQLTFQDSEGQPQLQYHHVFEEEERRRLKAAKRISRGVIGTRPSSSSDERSAPPSRAGRSHEHSPLRAEPSPTRIQHSANSSIGLGADLQSRGRSVTPQDLLEDLPRPGSAYMRSSSIANSPTGHSPVGSSPARSPDARHTTTVDLENIPYAQQMTHQLLVMDNAKLQGSVGKSASLLDTKKTIEMYRANVKKTTDATVQYQFAVFMVHAAQQEEATSDRSHSPYPSSDDGQSSSTRKEYLKEAKHILQRLADRRYPYAQYYLGDGFASGLFNGGKPDDKEAFGLFVAASKHGHAEATYRAALCHEFGWGCRQNYAKAVQYLRQAAAKGHPGAAVRLAKACLASEMGLSGKYREGITWMKRATESADHQHNSAPFELGLMHVNGYGPDVFKDEAYAAKLFTQAADLGHPEACLRMGEVYEHGLLTCPRDPALSIHFYNSAAQAGIPDAMMALCAWYMVGAEPVLAKDEVEAYEWARKAADTGLPKAEYAVGYFTEMGVGCRRDPLEANVWYVKAADNGESRAKQRLQIIRAAELGQPQTMGDSLQAQDRAVKHKKSGGLFSRKSKK